MRAVMVVSRCADGAHPEKVVREEPMMEDCERLASLIVLDPTHPRLTDEAAVAVETHFKRCMRCRKRFGDSVAFGVWLQRWLQCEDSELAALGPLPGFARSRARLCAELGVTWSLDKNG